jgi:hypothetical protein
MPPPRLVRGPLGAEFSLSRPRSGDVPSAAETNGDASSGVVGSRNGTSVNGLPITNARLLRDGDRLRVGDVERRFTHC